MNRFAKVKQSSLPTMNVHIEDKDKTRIIRQGDGKWKDLGYDSVQSLIFVSTVLGLQDCDYEVQLNSNVSRTEDININSKEQC
jgi:hypothetical protein